MESEKIYKALLYPLRWLRHITRQDPQLLRILVQPPVVDDLQRSDVVILNKLVNKATERRCTINPPMFTNLLLILSAETLFFLTLLQIRHFVLRSLLLMNEKKTMQISFFDHLLHSCFQELLLLLVLPNSDEEE